MKWRKIIPKAPGGCYAKLPGLIFGNGPGPMKNRAAKMDDIYAFPAGGFDFDHDLFLKARDSRNRA